MEIANFFADGSPFLHHPLLTNARTTAEIDFLLTQFDLAAPSRILDVGCGFGRHTIELAGRGYRAVGVDPSVAMIAAARARAVAVDAKFICVDGQSFTDDQPFDAAICLFTTLGQIVDDADNRALVDTMSSLLRSGGYFAVEAPQQAVAVRTLKTAERFGDGASYTDVTRDFDADSSVVTERFYVVSPQDKQVFTLRYRLFSAGEMESMLRAAGFEITARFSDYRGATLDVDSPTMLLIGRKP